MNATPGCLSTMPRGYASEPDFKGPYIAAEIIIALLAIIGNFLVCLAVRQNHKLRTVANYFLVSLSVADILVGLLAIPCAVLTDLGLPRHDLPLCLLLLSVLMVLTQSSILSLLAVAAERYVAILLPFQYQRIMSPRNARLALLFTWSLAMISGSVPLMGWHKHAQDADYCIFTCMVDMEFMVYFNFFGCLLVPLVVMFIMYGHIFLTIRRQLRRITAARGPAVETGQRNAGAVGKAGTGNKTEESRGVELTGGSIEVAIDAGTVNESGAETGERSRPEYRFESLTTSRGNNDAFGVEAWSKVWTGAEAGAGVEEGDEPRVDVEDGTGIRHVTKTKTEARFGDVDGMGTLEGMGAGVSNGDGTGLEVSERVFNRAGVRAEVGSGTRLETELGCSHGTGLALESSNRAWANIRPLIERARNAVFWSKPGFPTGSAGSSSSGSTAVSVDTCHRPAIEDKPAMHTCKEFRKATSLFLVLFLFMLCWMPIHIINCVLFLCPHCPVPMPLTMMAILLSHANSALNPLLYAYRMRSFRQTLRGMCLCCGQ